MISRLNIGCKNNIKYNNTSNISYNNLFISEIKAQT